MTHHVAMTRIIAAAWVLEPAATDDRIRSRLRDGTDYRPEHVSDVAVERVRRLLRVKSRIAETAQSRNGVSTAEDTSNDEQTHMDTEDH